MKQILFFDDDSMITLAPRAKVDYPLWIRLPHDMERVNVDLGQDQYIPNSGKKVNGVIRKVVRERSSALPEVYRFYPYHHVVLTKPLQLLWKEIMPELDGLKWRSLLGSTLAFTNNSSGLGGSTCHADFVNRRDLTCSPPSFDQARFTGGAIVRARRVGERYYIETIRTDQELPSGYELFHLKRHLWFYATSISPTGRIQYIQRMGKDGFLHKIRIPLFTEQEVYVPVDEAHFLGSYQDIAPNIVVYKGV